MTKKVRVYEVAKQLGIENKELIAKLTELNIEVRNHMSVVSPDAVEQVRSALSVAAPTSENKKVIAGTVVRRRRKAKSSEDGQGDDAPEVVEASPEPEPEAVAVVAATLESVEEVEEPAPVVAEAVVAPAAQEGAAPKSDETVEATPTEAVAASAPEPVETPAIATPAPTEVEPAAAAEPVPAATATAEAVVDEGLEDEDSDDPEKRFKHAPLPPGVVSRGAHTLSGAAPLSEERRRRIVAEHAASRPRRQVRGPGSIAPRSSGRPGKRRMGPGRKGKSTEITLASAHKRIIRIEDEIQVQKLAGEMSVKASDVLMKLMGMGVGKVHINSTIDADTAMLIAEEFGYEVENVARSEAEIVGDARGDFEDLESDRSTRAPVVTIMGHVDHGKTSLLDKIRSANVADGEAGGITQHISAFRVKTKKGEIVFLDTPGHEAFTEMRARGAQATDVVILVAAADDGVMPQTREAVSHSQAAKVPIIVAINKMDKEGASPDKVTNELAALGLQPEAWGGETIYVPTSAHTGQGIDTILDSILLQSEMLELEANTKIPAEGVVLESYLDRGRGPVANVLIRNGTLKAGEHVVAGAAWGRVRAMTNDRGSKLKEAGPSTPIEIIGFQEPPRAGDRVYKVVNAKKAQEVAEAARKPQSGPTISAVARGLESLQQMLASGDVEELNLVVKADVQGSIEALRKSFGDLSTDKVKLNVIHAGVGGITENDVMLASASGAIVIGFNVRPQGKATPTAKQQKVEIRTYRVIYEAIDDVKAAMAGLLAPTLLEKDVGKAEVREVFKLSTHGAIAGCLVMDGKMLRSGNARLVRDGVVVWDGELSSLQRFKDSVKEVPNGMECGIGLTNFDDIKAGDFIECYRVEEVAATL